MKTTSPRLKIANPLSQYQSHQPQLDSIIKDVLNSGEYLFGKHLTNFENNFAQYINNPFAIGVANGTDAIYLALKALGIKQGDEVITSVLSALPTFAAIALTGATAVLVDIEENYHTLDPSQLELAISEKTKAILPVHLYGQACDMEKIINFAKPQNIAVIEDCAQATGTLYKTQHVGTFGDFGCFSFYPTKNLSAFGDGGLVTTSNPANAEKIIQLRHYGYDSNQVSHEIGINSRMSEIQAAILDFKLKYLPEEIITRNIIAARYANMLGEYNNLSLPVIRDFSRHSFHLFVVELQNRNKVQQQFQQLNIESKIHYSVPIYQQPAYQNKLRLLTSGYPVFNNMLNKILSLPMFPGLTIQEQQLVCSGLT